VDSAKRKEELKQLGDEKVVKEGKDRIRKTMSKKIHVTFGSN
jgi:hypothetical protein